MNDSPRKILIITRKDLLIDVISVFLEGLYPCEITVADSSLKIDQFIESGISPDLVVMEEERLLATTGRKLADFLAPAIVISKTPPSTTPSGRRVLHLPAPVSLASLAAAFREVALSEDTPAREYCPVRLEILVLMSRVLTQDLYAQKSDHTYEVVLKTGDRIDLTDDSFARLANHPSLYVRAEDFRGFLQKFAADLQNLSIGPERVFDLGDSATTTAGVHELISSAIPELGFTPELQAATKASIDLAVNAIRRRSSPV